MSRARIGLREGAELRRRHGHAARAGTGVLERHAGALHAGSGALVQRARCPGPCRRSGSADGPAGSRRRRAARAHRDAVLLQQRARADARELQDLRRADRAGREDHLARRARRCAGCPCWRTRRPSTRLPVEHEPRRPCACGQDRRGCGRCSAGRRKRLGRAPAHAAPLVDLEVAAALVVAAVEVVDLRDAGLGRRSRKASRISQRRRGSSTRHSPPAPCSSSKRRARAPTGPRALEVGQHVVPGPAGIAQLAPLVVVARLAAHVDHAVDRGAAAQHLAARIVERAAVEAGLGLGLEAPVGARVADHVEVADRDVDPEVVVLAAGLEQQHARRCGSADRRLASTQPAVPAPTTMLVSSDISAPPAELLSPRLIAGTCTKRAIVRVDRRQLAVIARATTAPWPWCKACARSAYSSRWARPVVGAKVVPGRRRGCDCPFSPLRIQGRFLEGLQTAHEVLGELVAVHGELTRLRPT